MESNSIPHRVLPRWGGSLDTSAGEFRRQEEE